MLFDVAFDVSIPGLKTFRLVRSVEAVTAEDALSMAKMNICQTKVISVNPNTTGESVMIDPAVLKDKDA